MALTAYRTDQRRRSRRSKRSCIARALLAACAGACWSIAPTPSLRAEEPQPGAPADRSAAQLPAQWVAIEPQADQILRAAGKYLADAKGYTFTADIWEDVILPDGQKVQRQQTTNVGVRRPNGVYAESHNERVARGAWYDGKTFTIYNRQKNFFGTVDAPDTIDKTIEAVSGKFGIAMPLSDLLVADAYGGMIKNVNRGMYLGRQRVNDVRCHHLAFVQDDIDWEMWVEDGRAPLIRKLVITYKAEDRAPQFEATLSDWDFDVTLPDYAFTFRPPRGASRIEVLAAAKPQPGDPAGEDEGDARVVKEAQPADPAPPADPDALKPQEKKD